MVPALTRSSCLHAPGAFLSVTDDSCLCHDLLSEMVKAEPHTGHQARLKAGAERTLEAVAYTPCSARNTPQYRRGGLVRHPGTSGLDWACSPPHTRATNPL